MIARYGAFARPLPTPLVTGTRQVLAELLAYRHQLITEITTRSSATLRPRPCASAPRPPAASCAPSAARSPG